MRHKECLQTLASPSGHLQNGLVEHATDATNQCLELQTSEAVFSCSQPNSNARIGTTFAHLPFACHRKASETEQSCCCTCCRGTCRQGTGDTREHTGFCANKVNPVLPPIAPPPTYTDRNGNTNVAV